MFSKKDYYHRLSKFLAYSGITSRRKSESLIISGQVSVNGVVVTSVSQKVSSKDIVRYNGKKILYKSKPKMWIYHKPVGELCSDFDPSGKRTVFNSFPKGSYIGGSPAQDIQVWKRMVASQRLNLKKRKNN